MATVIDFSSQFPSAQGIKSAGHDGAVMYISPAREAWMKAKPAQKSVIEDFKKHGRKYAFVWQYAKGDNPATADVMRGFKGGVDDAKAAQAQLNKIGCPSHPVFFAIDFNITLDQWNKTAVEYFKGAASVLGKQRVGIYGHSRVIHWAMEDNVVATVEKGRVLGWQTKSWSNGVKASKYAVLYQGIHNVSGVENIKIDINEVLHSEWGWRPLPATSSAKPAPKPVTKPVSNVSGINVSGIKPNPKWRGDPTFLPQVLKAFGVKVQEWQGWRNRGHGDFGVIQGVIAHHTGTNTDIPGYIAQHPQLGLCSQIHLNRDGTAVITGAGIAWHAGMGSYPGWLTNNANSNTIGIEAASDGVSAWPAKQLDAYHRTCAAILWFLGKNATKQTLISHWEYSRAAQGKWDPGAGNGVSGAVMNMDTFRKNVQKYIDAARNGNKNDGGFLMALTDAEQKELLTKVRYIDGQLKPWKQLGQDERGNMTLIDSFAETRKKVNYIYGQLRPWKQLGQNDKGENLTLVDAVAALRGQVNSVLSFFSKNKATDSQSSCTCTCDCNKGENQ